MSNKSSFHRFTNVKGAAALRWSARARLLEALPRKAQRRSVKRTASLARTRRTRAANARLLFTSGATCPRQPDQTPHAAIERGITFVRWKTNCERRNGGVGPIRRDDCKSHLTDARRLAGQDVCTQLMDA
ncbi:hypothetical protein [Caballeronia sp. NK8]|uniref:hypothetical protein n=1 Tax=Caballeronia sp. NK8 TaxID=140098 RepID=UPI001BCE71C0|nr:hypothetical protein [Caballeronia sp. NK8]